MSYAFEGYASLFGVADQAGDVVEKGAFARSLARRTPDGIRMLFQHDPADPVGVWTEAFEDQTGLRVRGELTAGVARSEDLVRLIDAGAIDGLSIGFRTLKSERDRRLNLRRIVEIDLWEISLVVFPMLPGARLDTRSARPKRALSPNRLRLPETIRTRSTA